MFDFKTIGQNLKELRLCTGFRREIVAEFAGLTSEELEEVENGKRGVSADQLELLSDLYNVSIDSLKEPNCKKPIVQYAPKASTMNAENLKMIADIITKIWKNSEMMNEMLKNNNEEEPER